MSPGNVVLATFQQSDGQMKIRPAVIVAFMPPFNDTLIVALSSNLKQEVKGFDQIVLDTNSDFSDTGLKVSSLIRTGMVITLPQRAINGVLGSITQTRLNTLCERLADHITP